MKFRDPSNEKQSELHTGLKIAQPLEPEHPTTAPVGLPPELGVITHDTISNSRRRCDPRFGTRKPCGGAGSRLQSRLLRAILSERQLPESGTGKSLHRQLPASGLSGSSLSRSGLQGPPPGATATIAGTITAASGRAMSRPASSVARSAPRPPSPPPRSAAKPMPAATALSASPAPGSAARMAGSISASKASGIEHEKAAGRPPFPCAGRLARAAPRFWPFADKSGIRAAEDRSHAGGYFRRAPIASIRRFSSAVEQRFCKPKVGSSILSTGTMTQASRQAFFVSRRFARRAFPAAIRFCEHARRGWLMGRRTNCFVRDRLVSRQAPAEKTFYPEKVKTSGRALPEVSEVYFSSRPIGGPQSSPATLEMILDDKIT